MLSFALDRICIVLVEPAGGLNVGSIARAMKNMGLRRLVLVSPGCDPLGSEARQMAVHAVDVLEQAEIVATLPEALRGCQRAIATTCRSRTLEAIVLEHPKDALPWLLEQTTTPISSALIFGPEDRGLSNTELRYAQRFVYIPTSPDYPSLNLAQAVAICCHELYQSVQRDHPAQLSNQSPLGSQQPTPDSLDALEAYYHHLESVLLKIGYLYPHTADSRMQKFRRLYSRAMPSMAEVAMLRGVLSQVEWAIEHEPPQA